MFITKIFKVWQVSDGVMDTWLNKLSDSEHGIKVIQSHWKQHNDYDEDVLFITVQRWRRGPNLPGVVSPRTTIDTIPEEPSIAYPDGEITDHDEG